MLKLKNLKRALCLTVCVLIMISCLWITTPTVSAISTAGSSYSNNATIAARITQVFNAYPENSYFTKNGKACTCHGVTDCVAASSGCNCLRKPVINGTKTDLLGSQCLGYARYWQEVLFGYNDKADPSKFTELSGISGSLTAAKLKSWFANNQAKLHPGAHLRLYNSGHSVVLLKVNTTAETVTFAQANWGKPCIVTFVTLSFKDFATKFQTLNYAQVFTNYATQYPEVHTLTLKYHGNGGTIENPVIGWKYEVSDPDGLNLRSGAGTGYTKLDALPKGTVFTVNVGDTKKDSQYTWGKTTYKDTTGWVVISDFVKKLADLRQEKYYMQDSMVYFSSSNSILTSTVEYGKAFSSGLYNAGTFQLTRNGYHFVGWCATQDGSTAIFDKDDTTLKAEDIYPALEKGSATMTLYAIWEPDLLPGDLDGNNQVDSDDAIALLLFAMFGAEDYPMPDGANLDYDGSGEVDSDDAIHLLLFAMFGEEDYPLYG